MTITLMCETCNEPFNVASYKHNTARFCSRSCKGKWMAKAFSGSNSPTWKGGKITITCEMCNMSFDVFPSRRDKARFCSRKCSSEWRSKHLRGENAPAWEGGKIALACEWCNKSFSVDPSKRDRSRFCSRDCRWEWMSKHLRGENSPFWKGGKATITCETCNKPFDVKPSNQTARFCSVPCKATWLSGKNAPGWRGGKSFEFYPIEFNKQFKQQVRERDNYICAICWLPGKHVHHIDYNKQNTVLKNCITLCVNCHATTNSNRSYWQTQLSQLQEARHTRQTESLATLS